MEIGVKFFITLVSSLDIVYICDIRREMTAIKHTLQREVFLPSEERLISVVHVTKEGKKKKACFLCAAGYTLF